MAFFSNIGRKVSDVAHSVSESMGVSRLTSELRSARTELEQRYGEFGRLSYAIARGEGDQAEADALEQRIGELKARIEALSRQLQDDRHCPACGAELSRGAKRCAACGAILVEEARPAVRYCSNCGAALEEDENCGVCGMARVEALPEPTPEADPSVPVERATPAPVALEEPEAEILLQVDE